MKNKLYFIHLLICLTLSSSSSHLRFLAPESNNFDYSNIKSVYSNQNISESLLESNTADESVIYISDNNSVKLNISSVIKTGDANNLQNSKYYGVNSAILVNNAKPTFIDFNITTNASGSHGLS